MKLISLTINENNDIVVTDNTNKRHIIDEKTKVKCFSLVNAFCIVWLCRDENIWKLAIV